MPKHINRVSEPSRMLENTSVAKAYTRDNNVRPARSSRVRYWTVGVGSRTGVVGQAARIRLSHICGRPAGSRVSDAAVAVCHVLLSRAEPGVMVFLGTTAIDYDATSAECLVAQYVARKMGFPSGN